METVRLLKLDEANLNGRTYPTAVVEKAIERVQQHIDDGRFLGMMGVPQSASVPLDLISHSVKALRIENGYMVADVKLLDTPMAKAYQRIVDCKQYSMAWRPMGTGTVDEKGVITDYTIIAITAIPATEAA